MKKNESRGSLDLWLFGRPVLRLTGRSAEWLLAVQDWITSRPSAVRDWAWRLRLRFIGPPGEFAEAHRRLVQAMKEFFSSWLEYLWAALRALWRTNSNPQKIRAAWRSLPGEVSDWVHQQPQALRASVTEVRAVVTRLAKAAPVKARQLIRSLPDILKIFWRENGGVWFGVLVAVWTVALALGWVFLTLTLELWSQLVGAAIILAFAGLLTAWLMARPVSWLVDFWFDCRPFRAVVVFWGISLITAAYVQVWLWGPDPWVRSFGLAVWILGISAQATLIASARARDFLWGEQPIID